MKTYKPTVGRVVHYMLSAENASSINRRRDDATKRRDEHTDRADGSQIHVGNGAHPGHVYPMVITRVWGDQPGSAVNGQVLLDGNDTLWVTSVTAGEGEGHFMWPDHV